jgi:hypothetical protein
MWMRLGGGIYEGVREIEMFGWDGREIRGCVSRETYTPIVPISVLLLRECDVRSVPETDEAQSKFPANPLPPRAPEVDSITRSATYRRTSPELPWGQWIF